MPVPDAQRWLFWDADLGRLDPEQHAKYVLGRVLERGRLEDVRWAVSTYGFDRIHDFFRSQAHPEISARTRRFWQVFFNASEDSWPKPPPFRQNSSAPWID
jgi:hypothetical protein